MTRRLGLASLLVLGAAASAFAQAAPPDDDPMIDVDWNGVTIENLIVTVSAMTEKVFIFDRVTLKDKAVTMSKPIQTRRSLVYGAFETVMSANGFALVTKNIQMEAGKPTIEIVQVIKREEGSKTAVRLSGPLDVDKMPNRDEMITQVIPLKYASARDILAPAQALLSDPRNVLASETLNAIIITDYALNVKRIWAIIQLIDRKQPDVVMEVVPLLHASATELEPKLRDLVQTLLRSQPPRPGVPVAQQEQVSITADFRTNSMILLALQDRLEQIKKLIKDLDIQPEKQPTNLHVYRLKHARAETLATVLQAIFGGGGSSGTTRPTGGAAAGRPATGAEAVAGTQATPPNQQVQVSIVADVQNNALLVVATPEVWDSMESFIAELDRRRPQVVIETAIIEVTGNDLFDLGTELSYAGSPADNKTRGFGSTGFGLSTFSDTDGDLIPDIRVPNTTLQGLTTGLFRGAAGKLPIIIHALSTKTNINVLSLPQITTNDNEKATLDVSEIVTTAVTTTTTGVATTSAGAATSAGIVLNITPHISADNYLQLEIDLKVSQFQARQTADTTVPPPITNRSIITKVTLPNTYTVVVGGLVTNSTRETVNGIPILEDIPLLNNLFQRKTVDGQKTTLYIFITPIILADPDFTDFKRITLKKQEAIFQLSKRWVGVHQLGEHEPNAADLFEYKSPFGDRKPPEGKK